MEAPDAAMWVEGKDNSGRPIWRHRHNGATRFTNPWGADQTVAPHLNGGKKSVHFNLGPDPAQEAWEECFDRITGRNYWYNSTTRETTWIDPQVATKKPPPPPPSNPPPGSNPLQQPLSQLPPNQPGWSFSQAPSSFDAPSALGDPPSQPPSMPSRHGPSSQQAPATLGNPPSQMPAWPSREGRKKHKNERPLTPPPSNPPGWNTMQPFSSTFPPPPPQNPPGWTSDQPRSQWVPHPPPAFTAMSPQPPPPPPPPEFTPWQPQPSAPSLQPPPPPPPPPLPAPLKSGDSKKGAGETVATSWKPNLPKREQDDWSKRVNAIGKKEWFNEKTGRSQILRPDCLRKYR